MEGNVYPTFECLKILLNVKFLIFFCHSRNDALMKKKVEK